MRNNPSRPALRYHGSKWRIAPWVINHFPRHTLYVEPFGGGAAILLRKQPSTIEVYNDLDGEIVNFFKVLRNPMLAEELGRQLLFTPYSRAEYDLAHEPVDGPGYEVEQARRTMVKSFMGFASNAATAKYKSGFARRYKSNNGVVDGWVEYPKHIASFTRRLRSVTIECWPALEVLEKYDAPDTLFYVDPPYVQATRNSRGCYRHEMTDAQHKELAERLHGLQGKVVLSGYACPLYDRLYSGWLTASMETIGDKAAKRTERLWISPAAVKDFSQRTLLECASLQEPVYA